MAARQTDDLAALEDQDESVRIAVRALGDMRNSGRAGSSTSTIYQSSPSSSFQPTPALSVTSRSSSPSLPSPSVTSDFLISRQRDGEVAQAEADNASPDFVSRVSHFPIVNSALRVYEHSKASSRVVKYGAEMMESSVRSISRPVIERLPVNQLDEFACRQLDRLEYYGRRGQASRSRDREDEYHGDQNRDYEYRPEDERDQAWSSSFDGPSSGVLRGRRGRNVSPERWKGKDRDVNMIREDEKGPETYSRTPTPRQEENQQQQVVQRSRWQAMLLEAGGIGAAVSEESMRRLKYCLQWLQYATAHIDQQILILRDFIASLHEHSSGSIDPSSPHHQHLQTLTTIRRDVVSTIRQVVDVVSKYAGGALPEPAKARVRSFILCLPERWANAASATPSRANGAGKDEAGTGKGERPGRTSRARASAAPYTYGPGEPGPSSSSRSRPASRATSPTRSRRSEGAQGVVPTQQAAQKILTLAMESLDMLRAVTTVFKESLDKADAWVERLRIVGIHRPEVVETHPPTLPPPSQLLSPISEHRQSPASAQPTPPAPSSTSSSASASESPVPQNFATSSFSNTPAYLGPPSTATGRSGYRETLPPITPSPASTNPPSPARMSPYGDRRELQLPPLGPGAYARSHQNKHHQHQHSHQHQNQSQSQNHTHPHTEFGAMSLNGPASLPASGYATPRSATRTSTAAQWSEAEEKQIWERDWEKERKERERERRDGMDVDP